MTLDHPLFAAVAVFAAVAALFAWRYFAKRRTDEAYAYSSLGFLDDAVGSNPWPSRLVSGFIAFGVGGAVLALTGLHVTASVPSRDGSVVIALDTSGSMRATDVAPTRARALQTAARGFVDRLPAGTRVAVVAFSSGAYALCNLTDDRAIARDAIERIPPPGGATAIGDALELAARLLPATGRRVVVLVTDGVNNRGIEPVVAARELAARGIGIYTIGIGTQNSGETIPGTTEEATIDEDSLREIAAQGHGTYARAADASAIATALHGLAARIVWERKRIDASLPIALTAAFSLVCAIGVGALAGRVF